jgi:hypothetical protein
LSKHAQRCSSSWWGEAKGSEGKKNDLALAKLSEIMRGAVWFNVHALPHGLATFEIRQEGGYGARWDACSLCFF